MKKQLSLIALLILFLFGNAFSSSPQTEQEQEYWDFIAERLFGEGDIVSSFQEDIIIATNAATPQDSIIINELVKELKTLISTVDIKYPDEFQHSTSGIIIFINKGFSSYSPPKRSPINNGNYIEYSGFKGEVQPEIYTQSISIFLNDSVSLEERKRYINYAILRSLCTIKGDYRKASTFIENAVFDSWNYDPANTEFTEADKFLVKKLYSDSFQKEFKEYVLTKTTLLNYLKKYRPGLMKSIGFMSSVIWGLILLIFFYYSFFRRNFRYRYLGYIMPAFFMAISIASIHIIYEFLTSNPHIGSLIRFEMVLLPTFAIIISSILYILETLLLKKDSDFIYQLFTKTFLLLILSIGLFFVVDWKNWNMIRTDDMIAYGVIAIGLAVARAAYLLLKELTDARIRSKDLELSRLREQKTKAEIDSLHARINPHFLYNSLNSIAALAHRDPAKTEKMALSLSDLFRYTINHKAEQMNSIKEEVKMVRSYLEIEQIRFGERMSFSIDVDKETEDLLIPKFILQPLVENAIKHGISKIEGKGSVSLYIRKADNKLIIEVKDNGPDFENGLVSGYGLQSVYDLLKLTYGDKAGLDWENKPEKKIRIELENNTLRA